MNRLVSVFGIVAIVLNAAMGYSSTLLFCEHESGDGHIVSVARHASVGHQESCHSHSESLCEEHSDKDVCDSCKDTRVGGDDSQELLRNSQERVSAPPVLTVEFDAIDFAESLRPAMAGLLPLNRAPPAVDAVSVTVVKLTVLII